MSALADMEGELAYARAEYPLERVAIAPHLNRMILEGRILDKTEEAAEACAPAA